MADLRQREAVPEGDRRRQRPQSRAVTTKMQAEAARKAFMNCWEDVKEFFVDINSGLYSKGIISRKTFLEVHKHGDEYVLLPAIEGRLRLANSCAEFNTILDLLEVETHLQTVADQLSKEYNTILGASEHGPNGNIKTQYTLVLVVTVAIVIVLSAVVFSAVMYSVQPNQVDSLHPVSLETESIKQTTLKTSEQDFQKGDTIERYSTRILREVYELSPILGPEHKLSALYIEPTFYQVPKPNQVASLNPINLGEVLTVTEGDRVLIRGDPGTGKTMLTHAITQKWKEGEILTHCDLFAYRLRWFKKYTPNTELVDILKYNIRYQYKEVKDEVCQDNGRHVCFLLDGLDEYEQGYADDSNFFYELMLGRVLQKATVIVTSRNISDLDLFSWKREYRISLFSDEQRSEYFHEVFNQTGKNLTKVLSRHENVWRMCSKPLHAALLVKAFSNITLDTDIVTVTELFEQITLRIYERDLRNTHAIGKFDKIKTLDHLLQFPFVSTLCSLALDGFLARIYSFDYSELPDELKSTNSSYLTIETDPQCEGATNCKVYSFSHPSLMHFLAAVHLTTLEENKQTDLIFKGIHNDGMEQEVWKFFCGLTVSLQLHFRKVLLDKLIWKSDLSMCQCIYEAQSHSEHSEIQSVLNFHDIFQLKLYEKMFIDYSTLTAYDMQAIGFAASLAHDDLISISFNHISVDGDGDWLYYFLFSLTKPNTNFPNFERVAFKYIQSEIDFNTKTEQCLEDFFAHTPKLYLIKLFNVSTSLKQIAIYAPLHCRSITIHHSPFETSDRVTPYFEHCPNTADLVLFSCSLKDIHFQDMNMSLYKHNGRGLPRKLVLAFNDIGDEGAVAIASYIRRRSEASPSLHCGLMTLKLQHNRIGDRGLTALLTAVQVCPNFTLLDMSYNKADSIDPSYIQNMTLSSLPEELILESSDTGDTISYGLLSACSEFRESKGNTKCKIKRLILKSNHITSKFFFAFFEAAHTCCLNLTCIDLANNTAKGPHDYRVSITSIYDFRCSLCDYDCRDLVLYMDNSNVDDEGAAHLIKAIHNMAIVGHRHCRLTVLDLHFNRIGSKQLVCLFITAHTHCTNLTIIDLSYNDVEFQHIHRKEYYGSLTVYMSHSDIEDQEAADIAEHLKANCNLKSLDMSGNHISSLQLVEVFEIAHIFCPTLTMIDLSYNHNREMNFMKKIVRFRYHQKRRLMLYMAHSDIDDKAAVALTDYIRSTAQSSTPCSLSVVDLSSNHISSSHLIDILNALYTFCPNLTMVDLSNNRASGDIDQLYEGKHYYFYQSEVLKIYLDNSNIGSNEVSQVIETVAKYCMNLEVFFYFDDISSKGLVDVSEVCYGSKLLVYMYI